MLIMKKWMHQSLYYSHNQKWQRLNLLKFHPIWLIWKINFKTPRILNIKTMKNLTKHWSASLNNSKKPCSCQLRPKNCPQRSEHYKRILKISRTPNLEMYRISIPSIQPNSETHSIKTLLPHLIWRTTTFLYKGLTC